jgi:DNA-binding beta-propeller fold protein YncE
LHLEQRQSAGSGKPRGIHRVVRRAARAGRAVAVAAGLTVYLVATTGCGNTYRPVVSAINPVGPAGQPIKYVLAISSPTPPGNPCPLSGQLTSNGLMTMVDFSGDTVLVTATLGVNPYYFVLNSGGTTGYTLNCDTTVNSFDVSTSLISSQVLETTLLQGAKPVSLFPGSSSTYIADPGIGGIDQMTGTPPALKQELLITAGFSPIYVVGLAGAPRAYALAQATGGGTGLAAAIETTGNTISTTLPVGRGPVYGVMTGDDRRAFVLNETDGTVTSINVQTNTLDAPVTTIPVGVRPVWADFAPTRNELVVANEGTTTGSVSIVNISLCSSTALPTNPTCDPTNPVDATSFGTVLATVPVGVNPIMVTVLSDGTRAYVANSGIAGQPCTATTCTVSVVNLTSNTVTATIPINGHPVYIASTNSTPTGKVYVVCKDSQVMTVIETDTDTVDTTIPLQGYGVSVRVSQP